MDETGLGESTYVILPGNMLQRNRVDVLVEDQSKGDGEVEHVETLSTESIRKNLNSVGHNERSEGETIE